MAEPSAELTRHALVSWINTFEGLPVKVSSLEELSDGVVLCSMLCQIAPDIFTPDMVARNNTANWAIGLTNLKKLVRHLESYFEEQLQLQADFDAVDLAQISREHDVGEIVNLLELVVVGAVRSPERGRIFVNKIMEGLGTEEQQAFMKMTEGAMRRTASLEEPRPTHAHPASAQEVEELRAALGQAEEEGREMRQELEALKARVAKASDDEEELAQMVAQRDTELDTQRKRAEAVVGQLDELRVLYDAARLRDEEREADLENLRAEADKLKERAIAEKERADACEASSRRMADELDVAKAKAAELGKMEATLDKYKQKLDQAASARQHIKELEEQNAKYLDQVLSLEDEVKNSIPALKKTVESYKEKKMELEREKFKALEQLQLKDAEIAKLREEVETAQDAKRFLNDELVELRRLQSEANSNALSDTGALGLFDGSSLVEVKEKLARLERENRNLKRQTQEGGGSSEVLALNCQLQDAERMRAEREQELIEAKKRIVDLEGDAKKLREHVEELEERLTAAQADDQVKLLANELKAARTKLAAADQRAAEAERRATTAQADKDKLEEFTKATLLTTKEKYLLTLQAMKNENKELKDKNRYLEERSNKDKVAQKREERLLMSALYEVGLEIFESKITPPDGVAGLVSPPPSGR